MGANTKIEWADHSWSPWRGCTKVSPGCAHCYAETLSKRNPSVLGSWGNGAPRVMSKSWGDPVRWNERVAPVHCVNAIGDKFTVTVRRPRVFPSLCDWLDDEVPIEWLARFLELVHATPNLNWLLLTKRPENWRSRIEQSLAAAEGIDYGTADAWEGYAVTDLGQWLNDWSGGNPPSNVWFGVSVEDQQRADERIPQLLQIPARVRWLSVEPLIGPVDLDSVWPGGMPCPKDGPWCNAVHWAVVGGESGPNARPCNVAWIRDIVGQCSNAQVPVFVKQMGSFCIEEHGSQRKRILHDDPKGGDPSEWPEDLRVRQFPEVKP